MGVVGFNEPSLFFETASKTVNSVALARTMSCVLLVKSSRLQDSPSEVTTKNLELRPSTRPLLGVSPVTPIKGQQRFRPSEVKTQWVQSASAAHTASHDARVAPLIPSGYLGVRRPPT